MLINIFVENRAQKRDKKIFLISFILTLFSVCKNLFLIVRTARLTYSVRHHKCSTLTALY